MLRVALKTLPIAVFATILPAQAEESKSYFGTHVYSAHVPAKDYQQNSNAGIFYRRGDWQVGAYRNTLGRISLYGGYVQELPWNFELMGGLVSGYQKKCEAVYTPYEQGYLGPNGIYYQTEYSHTRTDCYGSSRGAVTAMVAVTWNAPFKVMGAQPSLWLLPPLPKHSTVLHFSLRWQLGLLS